MANNHPQYDAVTVNAPFTPDQQLMDEAKPIMIEVSAEEIARLWRDWSSAPNPQYHFQQYILNRMKAAGVPVEGMLHLKLAHGKLYKVGTELAGVGSFKYAWLPEAYAAGIAAWQKPRLEYEARQG